MERDNTEDECGRKKENIGAEGKRNLKPKEFKIGNKAVSQNEMVSQKCLVRALHAEHVLKEDSPVAAYWINYNGGHLCTSFATQYQPDDMFKALKKVSFPTFTYR